MENIALAFTKTSVPDKLTAEQEEKMFEFAKIAREKENETRLKLFAKIVAAISERLPEPYNSEGYKSAVECVIYPYISRQADIALTVCENFAAGRPTILHQNWWAGLVYALEDLYTNPGLLEVEKRVAQLPPPLQPAAPKPEPAQPESAQTETAPKQSGGLNSAGQRTKPQKTPTLRQQEAARIIDEYRRKHR